MRPVECDSFYPLEIEMHTGEASEVEIGKETSEKKSGWEKGKVAAPA